MFCSLTQYLQPQILQQNDSLKSIAIKVQKTMVYEAILFHISLEIYSQKCFEEKFILHE